MVHRRAHPHRVRVHLAGVDADAVTLMGRFNRWSMHATRMLTDGDGWWEATLDDALDAESLRLCLWPSDLNVPTIMRLPITAHVIDPVSSEPRCPDSGDSTGYRLVIAAHTDQSRGVRADA